ncbi:MAG: DEAD/DEAH box helicase family protein [Victivallales bacterium]|nr:DEAD/DEAH box helicase family protein [Victivallales bacterium]
MDKFSVNFTEEQRKRGEELLPGSHVIMGAPDRLTAEIHEGKQLFTVSFTVKDRRLIPECDCPTDGVCPHLWTALKLAEASGDLLFALKRNVSMRFSSSTTMTYNNGELQYEPEKSRSATAAVEEDQRRPEPRIQLPKFQLSTPNNATQIIFVLPIELQPLKHDAIRLDVYWRQTALSGEKPFPAKPLLIDNSTVIDSIPLARLLQASLPKDKSLPPNAFQLPILLATHFFEALDTRNLLRWTSNTEQPRKLHAATVDFSVPISFDIGFIQQDDQTFQPVPIFSDIPQDQILAIFPPSLILSKNHLLHCDFNHAEESAQKLLSTPSRPLQLEAAQRLARHLTATTSLPLSTIPAILKPEILTPPVKGRLYIRTAIYKYQGHEQLHAILSFDYDSAIVDEFESKTKLNGRTPNALIARNSIAEEALKLRMKDLGFRFNSKAGSEELGWKLHPSKLDEAVQTLVNEDWFITAEGKTYRKPLVKQPVMKSGIDWFDLQAEVDFDGQSIPLPDILKAQSEGANAVRLDDGTYGLLPLEWLQNFTVLTELGEKAGDAIRFKLEQAALIESLLEEQKVDFDETFRENVRHFRDIAAVPTDPPPSFHATLRPYQREGLGWLLAMYERRLGACLADDMGLGKTIQILAFIDSRHTQGCNRPTLVVVPKSLIFNWMSEAQKFTPHFRVRIHAGSNRSCDPHAFDHDDIVLTTYGTLRNDALKLAKIPFDTCILDESQTIKNAHAAAAEAARLIKADFRIAMTGTPIENSLSELASQLEFLNPGLFGNLLTTPSLGPNGQISAKNVEKIRAAVRPFILRRTKQQVATDLPQKTELVLWCELDETQRAEYENLRLYFRQKLLGKEDEKVAGQSTMDSLVALLRLRQAACHPGLLDSGRIHEDSAKLELVMDKIASLADEHHKVLVFSQFTTFLKIVAERLRQRNLPYAYLDGQTPDREAQVTSFQTNPNIAAFLISLKAGGVGLNLTAADYIFLLDPWWNPATEAQAIDRAYRIGQTSHVFAYKVITKDTIEEKVLLMQQSKRNLANSILDHENSGQPPKFTLDDLNFLLG